MKKLGVLMITVLLFGVFLPVLPAKADSQEDEVSLKVMAYNIHHAEGEDGVLDLERIAKIIENSDSDIIGLQEVDNHWSDRSDFVDQAKWLAKRLNMHYAYAPNLDLEPLNEGDHRRQYGTAVLSKYPIISAKNHPLTKIGNTEQRGLSEVVVNVKGTKLHVYNTHLALTSAERQIQVNEIIEVADQTKGHKIIMGDLNATPDSIEMKPLQAKYQDAFKDQNDAYTYSAAKPTKRIDYIFTSEDIEVEDQEVIHTLASDHLPLTAELEIEASDDEEDANSDVVPLAKAHAHNDYEHERPLFDALDHGFTSVEADVWLENGELLVAHDQIDVNPERTLESLYLKPLKERIQDNKGSVYKGEKQDFLLWIDIKSEGEATYQAIHRELENYKRILTKITSKGVKQGAVTVIISGNRPRELMENQAVRYATYDGRMSDLGSDVSNTFMPVISDNWTKHFTWQGHGEIPQQEREKLNHIVTTAHKNGQMVRFWATPDLPLPNRKAIWDELLKANVDLLNTDDLPGLQKYLEENDQEKTGQHIQW